MPVRTCEIPAATSAVLCAVAVALWVRSYGVAEYDHAHVRFGHTEYAAVVRPGVFDAWTTPGGIGADGTFRPVVCDGKAWSLATASKTLGLSIRDGGLRGRALAVAVPSWALATVLAALPACRVAAAVARRRRDRGRRGFELVAVLQEPPQ